MASIRPRSPEEAAPAAAAVPEPAAKKPKLEDEEEEKADRVPLMLSPAELDRIIDFVILKGATVDAETVKQIKSDAKAEFLPDVSKYKDKIYISLHIDLRGGEVNAHFTTTLEDWERVVNADDDEAFYLGDVCGKHSDIKIGFHPDFWIYSIEEDPYGIAKMVQMHGDVFPHWIEEFLAKQDEEEEQ